MRVIKVGWSLMMEGFVGYVRYVVFFYKSLFFLVGKGLLLILFLVIVINLCIFLVFEFSDDMYLMCFKGWIFFLVVCVRGYNLCFLGF